MGGAMRTIMIVLICVFLFIGSAVISAQTSVGKYTKEVLITAPWGSEPGKVGVIEHVPGMYVFGPMSFTMDGNNNIYLLDSGNYRILVYNQTGDLTNYITIPKESYGPSSIAYDKTNNELYINLMNHLLVFDAAGKLSKTIQCKENKSWEIVIDNGMIFSGPGVMVIEEAKKLGMVGVNGEAVYSLESHRDENLQQKNPKNKYTQATYNRDINTTGGESFSVVKKGNLTKVYDMGVIPEQYVVLFMRDTIKKESIYLAFPAIEKERPRMILKFNYDGDLVGLITDTDLLNLNGYRGGESLLITDEGIVYAATLDTEGLKIIKWTME
jgi:hypothetical protein